MLSSFTVGQRGVLSILLANQLLCLLLLSTGGQSGVPRTAGPAHPPKDVALLGVHQDKGTEPLYCDCTSQCTAKQLNTDQCNLSVHRYTLHEEVAAHFSKNVAVPGVHQTERSASRLGIKRNHGTLEGKKAKRKRKMKRRMKRDPFYH